MNALFEFFFYHIKLHNNISKINRYTRPITIYYKFYSFGKKIISHSHISSGIMALCFRHIKIIVTDKTIAVIIIKHIFIITKYRKIMIYTSQLNLQLLVFIINKLQLIS